MNIKFLLPKARAFVEKDEPPKRASQRFRGIVPLKYMLPTDGYIDSVDEATKDDIVIVAKAASVEDIMYLKDNGIKFVFDVCDDKWRLGRDHRSNTEIMNTGCKHADMITTTCEQLEHTIYLQCERHAHIIDDPYERDIEPVKFEPGKHLNLCYFGGRKSFSMVNWEELFAILDSMKIEYTLHATTQKYQYAVQRLTRLGQFLSKHDRLKLYEWDYELQAKLVRECDFVIMPISNTNPERVYAKSPNRVIDSIAQGRYVITTHGVISYDNYVKFIGMGSMKRNILWALDNPKSVISKIEEGQKYIQKHHSPRVIAKQWMSLRNKV